MLLDMGTNTSVFAGGYPGAAVPAAAGTSPQAPTSIGQKAFGIVAGDAGGPRTAGIAIISSGTIALGLLVFIWWSLPR
jgi:hypothetical protein